MSALFTQTAINVRERLNSLSNVNTDTAENTRILNVLVDEFTYESPTLSGATGTITAFTHPDSLIIINGDWSGWTSGAIATLSSEYRPLVAYTFGDIVIATSGAITPTTASGTFSGSYTV